MVSFFVPFFQRIVKASPAGLVNKLVSNEGTGPQRYVDIVQYAVAIEFVAADRANPVTATATKNAILRNISFMTSFLCIISLLSNREESNLSFSCLVRYHNLEIAVKSEF